MKRVENYRTLENEMSIAMRGDVALANNKWWLEKVWYFSDASDQFVVEVSQLVKPMTFAPMESICLLKTLFILRRGIAAKGGIPLSKGAVWGYDFLVEDAALVDPLFASALTYVEVLVLQIGRASCRERV